MIVEIWSEGETPRCGSGRRAVEVLSLGRKWARFRPAHAYDPRKRPEKITRETFDKILVSHIEGDEPMTEPITKDKQLGKTRKRTKKAAAPKTTTRRKPAAKKAAAKKANGRDTKAYRKERYHDMADKLANGWVPPIREGIPTADLVRRAGKEGLDLDGVKLYLKARKLSVPRTVKALIAQGEAGEGSIAPLSYDARTHMRRYRSTGAARA